MTEDKMGRGNKVAFIFFRFGENKILCIIQEEV